MAQEVFSTRFQVDVSDLKKVQDQIKKIGDAFDKPIEATRRFGQTQKTAIEAWSNNVLKASREAENGFNAVVAAQEKVNRAYEREAQQLSDLRLKINSTNTAMKKLSETQRENSAGAKKAEEFLKSTAAEKSRYMADIDAARKKAAEISKVITALKEELRIQENIAAWEKRRAALQKPRTGGKFRKRTEAEDLEYDILGRQLSASGPSDAAKISTLKEELTKASNAAGIYNQRVASMESAYSSYASRVSQSEKNADIFLRKYNEHLQKIDATRAELNGYLEDEAILNQKIIGTSQAKSELTKAEKIISKERLAELRSEGVVELNKIKAVKTANLSNISEVQAAQAKILKQKQEIFAASQKEAATYSSLVDRIKTAGLSEKDRKNLIQEAAVSEMKLNGLKAQGAEILRKENELRGQEVQFIREAEKADRKRRQAQRAYLREVAKQQSDRLRGVVASQNRSTYTTELNQGIYAGKSSINAIIAIPELREVYSSIGAEISKVNAKIADGNLKLTTTKLTEEQRLKLIGDIKVSQAQLNGLLDRQKITANSIKGLEERSFEMRKKTQKQFTLFRQIFFTGLIATGTAGAALNKIVKDAGDAEKAIKALNRQARLSGIFGDRVTDTVKNIDFVQNGLVSLAETSKAVRNLMRLGFGFDQAVDAVKKITEVAIENKQSALTLGEAVVSTTEGFRQELSVLADAGGITKNLSVIYDEFASKIGKTGKSLTRAEKNMALMVEINREAAISAGALDTVMNTLSGSVDAASGATVILNQELGDALKPLITDILKLFISFTKAITNFVKEHKQAILVLGTMAAAFASIIGAIGTAALAWTGITGTMAAFAAMLEVVASSATLAGGALATVGTALGALTGGWGFVIAGTAAMLAGAYAADTYANSQETVVMKTSELKNASADLQSELSATQTAYQDFARRITDTKLETPIISFKKELMSMAEVQASAFLQTRVEAAKTKKELLDLYTAINDKKKESIRLSAQETLTEIEKKRTQLKRQLSSGVPISKDRATGVATDVLYSAGLMYENIGGFASKGNISGLAEALTGKTETPQGLSAALTEFLQKNQEAADLFTDFGLVTKNSKLNLKRSNTLFKVFDTTFSPTSKFSEAAISAMTTKTKSINAELTELDTQTQKVQDTLKGFYASTAKPEEIGRLFDFKAVEEAWKLVQSGGMSAFDAQEIALRELKAAQESLQKMAGSTKDDKTREAIKSVYASFNQLEGFLSGATDKLDPGVLTNLGKIPTFMSDATGKGTKKDSESFAKIISNLIKAKEKESRSIQKQAEKSFRSSESHIRQSVQMLSTLDSLYNGYILKLQNGVTNKVKVMDVLKTIPKEAELTDQITTAQQALENSTEQQKKFRQEELDGLLQQNTLAGKARAIINQTIKAEEKHFNAQMQLIKKRGLDTEEKAKEEQKLKDEVLGRLIALQGLIDLDFTSEELDAAFYDVMEKVNTGSGYGAYKKSGLKKYTDKSFGLEGKLRAYKKFLADKAAMDQEAVLQNIATAQLEHNVKMEMQEELRQTTVETANTMKQAFVDGYMGILDHSKTFSDMLYDVFKSMVDRINRLVVERAIEESFIGSFFDSIAESITKNYAGAGGTTDSKSKTTPTPAPSKSVSTPTPAPSKSVSTPAPTVTINISAMDGQSVARVMQTPEAQNSIVSAVYQSTQKSKVLA